MELLRQQFTNVLQALSNRMEWCHNQIHNVLSFSDKVIIKGVLARPEKKFRAQTCSNVASCDTNWAVPVLPFFPVCASNWSAKEMLLALFCTIFWDKGALQKKKLERVKISEWSVGGSPSRPPTPTPPFSFNTVIGWHYRDQIHRLEIFS